MKFRRCLRILHRRLHPRTMKQTERQSIARKALSLVAALLILVLGIAVPYSVIKASSASILTNFETGFAPTSANTTAIFSFAGTIIAAGIAAYAAIYSKHSDRKQNIELANIKAKLATQKSEEDAIRDYKSDARKRVYEACEPILFQFTELCEEAKSRILSLAEDSRQGRLGPFNKTLSRTTGSSQTKPITARGSQTRATVYFILAPLANFKILQRQLTLVDLKFDTHAKLHYLVAKILYHTFIEDREISRREDRESEYYLCYEPDKNKKHENFLKYKNGDISQAAYEKGFTKYSRQGIGPGAFEIMLDGLIKGNRVISFSEFTSKFGQSWHKPEKDDPEEVINAYKVMKPAMDIFRDFHPNRKPVLWRILLAQLCLYRALEKIRNDDNSKIDEMCEAFNDMYDIDSEVEWGQEVSKLKEDMAKWKEKTMAKLEEKEKEVRKLKDAMEVSKLEEKEKTGQEVSKLKEDMAKWGETKLEEKEKEVRKLKDVMEVSKLEDFLDVYVGDKKSDNHSIEAVKYYLNQKLKERYDAEKREKNYCADMSVPSLVAWKYAYFKIVHALHPTRRLDELKTKIKGSYKNGRISQQQYVNLENKISLFCKESYEEKIKSLPLSDINNRHVLKKEIADAYAKGWIIGEHYNSLKTNLENSDIDAESQSNKK
jgi:hypothetical protein